MPFTPITSGAPSAIGAGTIAPSSQAAGGLSPPTTIPLATTTTITPTPTTALARPGALTLQRQIDLFKSGRERETARNSKAEAKITLLEGKITRLQAAGQRLADEVERLLLFETAWLNREYPIPR
ncbi:hypothetical protein MMC17_000656 [Xylographa soralifera]|nr:hypothetical protein [Xylographa soralifera]